MIDSQRGGVSEARWAGDVLIIGGGASGLLSARTLRAKGLSVTLIDRDGAGAAQSNHSHGYLHRGHIYAAPTPALVAALNNGADRWHEEFSQASTQPELDAAIASFTNPQTAAVAAQRWEEALLEFSPTQRHNNWRQSCADFSTREATFDLTSWLTKTRSELISRGVHMIRGAVTDLLDDGNRLKGAACVISGERVVLSANQYVVTAGTGNLALASTATRFRGRALNRLSFMMVLKSKSLEKLSLVSPENESYGLFVVSRQGAAENERFWLVSNYLGFAGSASDPYKWTYWARATLRLLRDRTNVLDFDDLQWGGYAAPKGELRTQRGRLDVHSVETYATKNMIVGAPSKLTLAPLLADEIVHKVIDRVDSPGPQAETRPGDPVLGVCPERWLDAELFSRAAMLRTLGGKDAPAIPNALSAERQAAAWHP